MQETEETWDPSLGQEDPLEQGQEYWSTWEIPQTEGPGRLRTWGHKELDKTEQLSLQALSD